MRIAYVLADTGNPIGGRKGASVHAQEMIRGFSSLGHEVEIVCARAKDRDGLEGIPLIEVDPISGQASRAGEKTESVTPTAEKEARYVAVAERVTEAIVQRHREQPFDAIYERYALWSAAGVCAGQRLGIPVAVEVNSPLRLEQQAYRRLESADTAARIERQVFAGADAVIAVSAEVAHYVASQGARRQNVHVIPNGVDTERFHPAITPIANAKLTGKPVIGFTGSLKPWHGLEGLLESFRTLAPRFPDAQLLIVGEGPMRGWIEGFAAGSALADRIHLTGWIEHAELPHYVAAMNVAVAPYPELDGFYFSPLKLFEYLAAGRPIIASAIGQITEILEATERMIGAAPKKK